MTDRDTRLPWSDMEPDDAAGAELFQPQGHGRPVCPAPELVQAARAGVLPEALQAQVLAHVERCSMCRALADGLDDETVGEMTSDEFEQVLGRIRSADARESQRPARRAGKWKWYAAAAIVVLVTAGAVLVRQFRSRPVPPGPADQILRLEPPGGRGGPSVLLRSSRRPGEAEDLSRALEPFRTNDYAEAVRRLRDVLTRHPQSALGYFYLGVGEMFLDRNADAVRTLQKAKVLTTNEPDLEREIQWYLSLAYYRTGQSGSAAENLKALCAARGPRVVQACLALRALHGPITLSGIVTAPDGTPLSGVTLSEWDVKLGPEDHNVAFPTGLTATTDDRGRYSVTGDLVVRTPWVIWMARKPGYFSIGNISRTTSDAQIDLVMNPWTYIALGEVVRGTVKPGDTVCGEPNERCHYFALTVPAGGRLETTLTTAIQGQGWDLHVETAAGEAYGPPMGAPLPLRVSIQVEAAATYQIRVLSFSPTPSDYELTTRLH